MPASMREVKLRGVIERGEAIGRLRTIQKIRAANVPLPSPLWGEGLGVRGDSHSTFIRKSFAIEGRW